MAINYWENKQNQIKKLVRRSICQAKEVRKFGAWKLWCMLFGMFGKPWLYPSLVENFILTGYNGFGGVKDGRSLWDCVVFQIRKAFHRVCFFALAFEGVGGAFIFSKNFSFWWGMTSRDIYQGRQEVLNWWLACVFLLVFFWNFFFHFPLLNGDAPIGASQAK